jgi:hypothetical protein
MTSSSTEIFYYPAPPSLCRSVAEQKSNYLFFTERHIQAMWLEQKYFRNPILPNGEVIRVISPGIWNNEAGPDFLKAHLWVGNRELKGDVEIHFSQSDWEAHGHYEDPRYNQVVLHVCLWKSKLSYFTRRCDGQAIPTLFLEDFLTISLERISSLIDLDQYPYRKCVGSGRCSRQLFNKIGLDKSARLLQEAAIRRLEEKGARMIGRARERKWAFPLGIARALGYKANGEAFEQLFLTLIAHRDRPADEILSLALGICGFFNPERKKKWGGITRYDHLHSLWPLLAGEADEQIQLQTHQIRPINHPIRRIALLVKFLTDPYLEQLEEVIFNTFLYGESLEKLTNRLPIYTDPYWNHRYTFEEEGTAKYMSLMGDDLKSQIMTNGLYPLLYEKLITYPDELNRFFREYRAMSAIPSGKSEYLTHRFFGEREEGALLGLEMHQQGAYQIHKDYCVHHEASCEGCPFVDRITFYE